MVSKRTIENFARIYPEFTKESVRKALREIEKRGKIDAITLDYYLRQKRFGGLGMSVTKKKKLKKVM